METKPGIKTTEFYVTIAAQILSILALLGVFTPEQADAIGKAIPQLVGIAGVVASAFGYSIARGQAKIGVKPAGENRG